MKKLSLGVQSFLKLIKNDCVYVDKTKQIYDLIGENCVFFARPRRFGKSLLCSTLKELFLGNRELFKGLWIDTQSQYDWQKYPVIHLDLSMTASETPEDLKNSIMRSLSKTAKLYKVGKVLQTTPGEMLEEIVISLQKKYEQNVVIIIDEYDSPIINHLYDSKQAQNLQDVLKVFYAYIKGLDEYLKFVFVTGVSRFSKAGVFSGMNQLTDISMDPRFAHLIGYTEKEILFFFSEHLEKIALLKKIPLDNIRESLRVWYNGYRFWDDMPYELQNFDESELACIYSPYSVTHFIDRAKYKNYWSESATPKALLDLIKISHYTTLPIDGLTVSQNELSTIDIFHIPLTTILFQTGYLTIKSYDPETKYYVLGYPNKEVAETASTQILTYLTQWSLTDVNALIDSIQEAIRSCDINKLIKEIKRIYSKIPNTIQINQEKYFQSIFYTTLMMIGTTIDVEVNTNIGRIDATIETKDLIYIIEFKLDKTAKIAMDQIKEKKYSERYLDKSKKIILLGINFSSKEKNINEYLNEIIICI